MLLYFGVVEDIADPKEIGRVRVRVFGVHNDDIKKVNSDELPWATCMSSVFDASSGGVGQSNNLVAGSNVIVTFAENDEYKQSPIVLGSIKSLPSRRYVDRGFTDPNAANPQPQRSTDVPEEATSGWRNTYSVAVKDLYFIEEIPFARNCHIEFDPWETPIESERRKTVYGKNMVTRTESGSIIEQDATPGFERIAHFHPSGSQTSIYGNGDEYSTIVGDDFEINIKDKTIYIRGDYSVTVDGDYKKLIRGDAYFEVLGNYYETIHEDKELHTADYIATHKDVDIKSNNWKGLHLNIDETALSVKRLYVDLESTISRDVSLNAIHEKRSGLNIEQYLFHSHSAFYNLNVGFTVNMLPHIFTDDIFGNILGRSAWAITAGTAVPGPSIPVETFFPLIAFLNPTVPIPPLAPEILEPFPEPDEPIVLFEEFEELRKEYHLYLEEFAGAFLSYESSAIKDLVKGNTRAILQAIRENTSVYKLQEERFKNVKLNNRDSILACAARSMKELEIMGLVVPGEAEKSQIFRENPGLAEAVFEFVEEHAELVEEFMPLFL